MIWVQLLDGRVARRCAHCSWVFGRHEESSPELVAKMTAASTTAHAQLCPIPTRAARPVSRPTPSRTRRGGNANRLLRGTG